jgi:hypothetical protein
MIFDVKRLIKYLLEGSAVAIAAFYIPQKKVDPIEIGLIALTAAAIFMILDYFAPAVASGARTGAGFGIGYGLVQGGGGGHDGVEEDMMEPDDVEPESEDVAESDEPIGQDSGEGFASVI